MDTTNRRPQLPALTYLDVDKVKREEEAYQNNRNTGLPHSLSTSAGASPTFHYPPGPPPPYAHNHAGHPAPPPPPPNMQTNTWSGAPRPANTPPESRLASEHDKDSAKYTARQSLPSISEALGDGQTAFGTTLSQQPPSLQSSHLTQPISTAPASPKTITRTYPMEPPHTSPSSFSNNSSSYPSQTRYRADSALPYPSADAPRASYPSPAEAKPAQHTRTPQSNAFSRAPEGRSGYDSPPPQTNGSMPPPATTPYGYTPYPPRYANAAPPATTSAGPIFPPSTAYASQQATAPPVWKSGGSERFNDRQPGQAAYGDNVKRHLDFYDLESALNEIAATSGILSDFSRRYGDRMHQTQRSGPSMSTLPGIVEVDDMVAKTRVQLDSLLKIRDVILTQQAVHEQQVADQRKQNNLFQDQAPSASHADLQHQQQHPYGGQFQDSDDGKMGGFAGMDTKKRRGRAAPPGRCHSCNRAETPEWRRGPDGARTLCNACGLHYAKLTRKSQGANKSSAVGSSNLRPKENMD
ncbi:unnamed protein product [Zymoseptoria tritici ST99CH_3D1]|nr:unnamed protein product [Zymoseptoria tritici ST99CH_3D1]